MLNTVGTFWKSLKLIPSKKNESVLIAKISSRKTKKSPIRRNYCNSHKKFVLHSNWIVWTAFKNIQCENERKQFEHSNLDQTEHVRKLVLLDANESPR